MTTGPPAGWPDDGTVRTVVQETRDLIDVLRDVLVDYVPPCKPREEPCVCSAARARRVLARHGVSVE